MEHDLIDHVVIRYHSAYAIHHMTIPTRTAEPGIGTGGDVGYHAWDTTVVDAGDMIEALLTAVIEKFPITVIFDSWTVMKWNAGTETWNPVGAASLTGFDGTDNTPGWTQAVQSIFTFYDTAFNTMKFTLLDTSSRDNFARRTSGSFDTDEVAIIDILTSDAWAWASRAVLQPMQCRSVSLGINDELKKQYPGI